MGLATKEYIPATTMPPEFAVREIWRKCGTCLTSSRSRHAPMGRRIGRKRRNRNTTARKSEREQFIYFATLTIWLAAKKFMQPPILTRGSRSRLAAQLKDC